ncbi:MAG: hypothetical protein ACLP5H_25835 [Desulfomonilaceae bacterium]
MNLLTVKDVAEKTGIPLGTLRFYLRTGKSPFNFKRLPSGRIVISAEELKNSIDALPNHKGSKAMQNKGKNKKDRYI